ncbi:hypothetical protein K457DRAFT_87096 [Linnemannia elongata AG-77]|uniref:Exonuclease domain-containing protein n=1 Tax=Linnemannia elongata AG-77 TaxID=1314771 RepID=A0A197KCM2_9FUNG|nr:hypothetical protein K457DRAFT_87096 [Linnemannia elongata AG-77]
MVKKRKFAPGAWKEDAFRESITDSSDSNGTQETEGSGAGESNTMAVDQDTQTSATTVVVEESTLEEVETVDTPEKKQKIEGGEDGDAATPVDAMTKEERRKLKKEKKKQANLTKLDGGRPSILLSRNYNMKLKLKDLRDLIVYLLTETKTLPWTMVKNKFNIQKVVLLYVGGLDPSFFGIDYKDEDATAPVAWASTATEGPITEMTNLKRFFDVVSPMKAGGEKHKIYSPVGQILNIPLSNTEKAKREAARAKARVPDMKRDGYMLTPQEMQELEFPLPSYMTGGASELKENWIETDQLANSVSPDQRKLVAMDCEMCLTEQGSELTRITLIGEDGKVIYDELVLPTNPITDYLTKYSGMTAERLSGVTTRLADVQKKLKELIDYDTILIGHSLENDMKVLKFAHPFIIDTARAYHHTRGPPSRPSLKWLAYRWLERRIQNGGDNGHDSVEDALTCLDLIKLKIKNGQGFGEYYNDQESVFSRIKRYTKPRTSAVIDDEFIVNCQDATTYIKTTSDAEVVTALPEAMKEHHFVWARLRDLEINYGKPGPDVSTGSGHHPHHGRTAFLSYANRVDATEEEVREAARSVDKSLAAIVEAMPPNTAFLVTSGQGDPREMFKYQELQKKYQALYNTVSISTIPKEDRFDDEAQAALELGVEQAKNGVCFFMVK